MKKPIGSQIRSPRATGPGSVGLVHIGSRTHAYIHAHCSPCCVCVAYVHNPLSLRRLRLLYSIFLLLFFHFPNVFVAAWLSVNGVAHINEVTLRRARLVLGWVTVSGFNSRCGTFFSVCDQPPRSTQPGYPFVDRHNEYQPKSGDALRLGSKGRYGSCVGGR